MFVPPKSFSMKLVPFFFYLCITVISQAQVGIGTQYPNAALDIATTPNGIPALELNPQSAPIGTETGQLAVIGDLLYMYDEDRGKWLSTGTSTFTFGREGSLNNSYLEYAGDITTNGPTMPSRGTIVYVTINSSGGFQSKLVTLETYSSDNILKSTRTLQMVNGKLIVKNANFNFSEGDYFRVLINNDGNLGVNDVSVVLWTKWRY